jgi:hypothetical protein
MSEHDKKVLAQKIAMQKKYIKMEKALNDIIEGGECNYSKEIALEALKKD